jgi:uncharacterized protein
MNTCNSILTFSGQYVDLLDPDPDTINIGDIAKALSQINRFGGHTRVPYTVAQHSLLVSENVPPEFALQALLHDAAEAYVGDVVRPLKYMADMRSYRDRESIMQAAIYQRFGLGMHQTDACRSSIRCADLVMLATERRDLMPPCPTPWPILHGVTPLAKSIRPAPAPIVAVRFMKRFEQLMVAQ